MSDYFAVYCENCETWGPEIRRGAGGTSLLEPRAGFLSWPAFLIEHAYCPLRLVIEGRYLVDSRFLSQRLAGPSSSPDEASR